MMVTANFTTHRVKFYPQFVSISIILIFKKYNYKNISFPSLVEKKIISFIYFLRNISTLNGHRRVSHLSSLTVNS